jgi:hypothetical protein
MKSLLIGSLLVFGLLSCVKNNPNPSYVTITPWTLVANPDLIPDEGFLTQNFSNAWVFANGQLIGIFELPVTLPVLSSGITNFQIYPTILDNGISATKKIYPFVDSYDVSVNLIQNQTVTINPVTRYKSNAKVTIVEDFDGVSPNFEDDPNSMATLYKDNAPQYLQWGSGYGLISLTPQDSMYVGYSIANYTPPKGQEVYLEIDYRNSNDLETGILEVSSQGVTYHPNIQLNDQDLGCEVWKKIYIDVREIISGTPNAQYYKLTLKAFLEAGGVSRDIMIDNIKLVHF